ncbi:MAG: DUF6019 family protein [Defluviitaleaceae bacterium]|nr:DUF6019 family protein [Defluviitaleaceae bacterium]
MDIHIIPIALLTAVIVITILYYVIKTAVRNGTIEARAQTEQHTNTELKKAIRDAINTALESREKQNTYELKNAIYEGIKASIEDQRRGDV